MAKKKTRNKVLAKMLPVSSGLAPDAPGEDTPLTGGNGVTQERRIKDCPAARELFVQLYLENQQRANSWAQIRNQIEGGRPFDQAELVRNGEGWRTNVNFQDARAAFRRASLPYWKMVNEVPHKVSITLHSKAPQSSQWAIAMATAFDMFHDDWGSEYYKEFSGFCDDFVMYGPAFVMWPDAKSPRYKWTPTVQVMFPKRTKSNVDEWELVAIRREMTATELIQHIGGGKSEERSKTKGWNPSAIRSAIKMSAPGQQSERYLDPNIFQDMIVSNDLYMGGIWPPIAVVDIFAASKDGKSVRHYIFTEKSNVNDYIYNADEEAPNFRQIFGPAFYGVGSNGLVAAIKGFGVMNYYYATALNRMKCRALDSATFAMGMNFTKDDNTPDGTPPVENVSMLNVFPTGLKQLQWYPQLQAGTELMQELKSWQDENNFQYNEIKDTIADTDTATQAKLVAGIGAEMGSSTSAIFLSQVGQNHYTEQVRRMCDLSNKDEDCVLWRKRCMDMGVPEAAFKLPRTVKTGASPALADPAQRAQTVLQMRQMFMNSPGANRRWFDEQAVAVTLGAEAVNKALLPEGQDSEPAARRQAMMENVDLGQGMPLPAAPEDAHVEHIDEHLKPMEAFIQALTQGQTKMSPDHMVLLQTSLPHIQQHLQYLSQDETKKPQYQQLNARFSRVASVAQGLAARLAKAHQTTPGDPAAAGKALVSQP